MNMATRQEKAVGLQALPDKGSGVVPAGEIKLLCNAHD